MGTEADREELVPLSDGPSYWPSVGRTLFHGLAWTGPLLSLLGGLGAYLASHSGDWSPPVVFATVIVGFVVIAAFAIPNAHANNRRRRDLLLGQLACATSPGRARVCWTAWLLDADQAYVGSLHLVRGVIRFLWHQGAAGVVLPDPRSEIVFEVVTTAIAAVETEPARSIGEWWRCGSQVVLLILHDGRRVRFGAPQAERLASALRARLGRPEGTPVAPSPADFSLEEIGQSLAQRYPLVALIVRRDDGLPPHVVLHGPTEALRGALENARDVVVQERKALVPYANGLVPADPKGPA